MVRVIGKFVECMVLAATYVVYTRSDNATLRASIDLVRDAIPFNRIGYRFMLGSARFVTAVMGIRLIGLDIRIILSAFFGCRSIPRA